MPSRCTASRPSRWSAPPAATKYGYGKDGKPILTKEPKLLLNDNNAGKPEGIHLMIGRRPYAAFGNSTGDRQMLEYTGRGDGARLMMLVLHDDATREYAYGPAEGLPDTKVGTFTPALYAEAKKNGWTVISMKNGLEAYLSLRVVGARSAMTPRDMLIVVFVVSAGSLTIGVERSVRQMPGSGAAPPTLVCRPAKARPPA